MVDGSKFLLGRVRLIVIDGSQIYNVGMTIDGKDRHYEPYNHIDDSFESCTEWCNRENPRISAVGPLFPCVRHGIGRNLWAGSVRQSVGWVSIADTALTEQNDEADKQQD